MALSEPSVEERRVATRPGGYSLRFSLGVAFGAVVLLTCGLLGTLTWYQARSVVREDIRVRLRDLSAVAALSIDPAAHEALRSAADEATDTYGALSERLRAFRSAATDIRYAYTMRHAEDGRVVFVLDAEESEALRSGIGDVYEDVTPLMTAVFEGRQGGGVEESFVSDAWGTWLSGYAPIRDAAGRTVALVGLDISAARVLAYERHMLALIAGVSVAIGALGLLLGSVLSRRISRPLVVLEQEMLRIRRFELEGDVPVRSRIAEVNEMKNAVENMKQGLRSFRRYVPAELVSELIRLGREARLGAERRTLTIFFCDIAGFTSVAETLTPEELAERLGTYLEGMTRILLEEGGTVDKYIGDAIMAFWGAPSEYPDHAERACRAALRCRAFVEKLSAAWRASGLPAFETRFGLNTGEVNVGNFGFAERLNYTAMGDSVNLASRLEGLNTLYGTRILVSGSTRALLGAAFRTRLVDRVAVKGRSRGVEVYELLDAAGPQPLPRNAVLHERGLRAYAAGRWDEAIAAFQAAVEADPADGAAAALRERCVHLGRNPPGPGWDGTWVMKEK